MKIKVTYKCPIGPIESNSTEYTLIMNVSMGTYLNMLNNPNDITKIEVLQDE